ncbi:hypothetical protein [Shewanella sp. TC10]|uniref:hypothetical protein n=1 Tax=Shewanella sp. TC10 TaxID=1419739 RepID=UPI00129DD3B5|nr:hypothetical protein [Shewanella sp. TC10]
MSNKDKPQADATNNAISDEAFAALQEDISALYKQQDLERPSAAIDAAILLQAKAVQPAVKSASIQSNEAKATSIQSNAAKATRTNVVKVSFWKKHRLPLSSAASVMLIASVMLLNPEFNQHAVTELDDSIPVVTDTPAPAMMRSAVPDPQQTELSQSQSSVNRDSVNSGSVNRDSAESSSVLNNTAINDAQIPQQQTDNQLSTSTLQNSTLQNDTRHSIEMQVLEEFSAKELQSMTAPTMQHDSLEKAMIKLTELVNTQDYAQAERYMLTIEQRFPDIVKPEHPQFKQFTELKQQLTLQ